MQLASVSRTNCVHPMKDFQRKKMTWIPSHYIYNTLFGTLSSQYFSTYFRWNSSAFNKSLLKPHILTSLPVQPSREVPQMRIPSDCKLKKKSGLIYLANIPQFLCFSLALLSSVTHPHPKPVNRKSTTCPHTLCTHLSCSNGTVLANESAVFFFKRNPSWSSQTWMQWLLQALTSETVTGFNMPEKHSQSIQRLTYTAQQRIVCFIKSAVDTAKGRNSSKISSLHSCMLCCMLIELPVLYSHKKWIGFTQASKQTLFDNLPSPRVKNSFTGLSVLYVIFRLVN